MKPSEAKEGLARAIRRAHYSEKTVESYVGWLDRFLLWCARKAKEGMVYESNEERVADYLGELAPVVTPSTQRQALCALVYFHREVAGKALGQLPDWVSAKRPRRLPEWVTPAEAMAIFERMKGIARLMAELQFGSGLRLAEVTELRIKDVRLDEGTIMVRGGKGDKDRVTILPASLVAPLRDMFARSRLLWEDDRRDVVPGVALPQGVARKYPTYGERWEWHWVFPSHKLSTDPASGIVRRHHVHPDLLNKAVTKACALAKLGRRVTSHAFRHGFATALLASGRTVQEVAQLLGHASIETTQVYLHCLPRLEERLVSPLDVASNVTPMRRTA